MFTKRCENCGRVFSIWEWLITDTYAVHIEFCKPEPKSEPKPVSVPKFRPEPKVEEEYTPSYVPPKPKLPPPPPPVRRDHPKPAPTPRPSSGTTITRKTSPGFGTQSVTYRETEEVYVGSGPSILETIIAVELLESAVDSVCDAVSSCFDED